jgi:uncharacterized OB-fold protein
MSETNNNPDTGRPPSDWGAPGDAYWAALDDGHLDFQVCDACGNHWLPPRSECPKCWSPDWHWQRASGRAEVVSWVVYHTAFDARFRDRLPYNVAVVQLEEGPRMVTNLIGVEPDARDLIGRKVMLSIERDLGRSLPRFRLED